MSTADSLANPMEPPPTKSHLNHVVLDGIRGNSWEEGLAHLLEQQADAYVASDEGFANVAAERRLGGYPYCSSA